MKTIEDIKKLIQRDYERKVKRFLSMPPCKVLLVGDSMVDYYKPKINICKQGIAGDTSIGVKNRINAIINVKPKQVIIHVGTNDLVLTTLTIKETVDHLIHMREVLRPIPVFFCTPIPVDETAIDDNNKSRTNEKLHALRQHMILSFNQHEIIDLYPIFDQDHGLPKTLHTGDGLHLNEKGYEVYERSLYTYIKEYINEQN